MLIPVLRDRTTKPPLGTPLRTDGQQPVFFDALNAGAGPTSVDATGRVGTVVNVGSASTWKPDGMKFTRTSRLGISYPINSIIQPDKLTLHVRVTISQTPSSWSVLIAKPYNKNDFEPYGTYGLYLTDSTGIVFRTASGSRNDLSTSHSWVVGRTYDIFATFDGTTKKIFVDGVQKTSVGWANVLSYDTSKLCIGANVEAVSSGNYDECEHLIHFAAVYPYAMTLGEIKDVCANPWRVFEPEIVWVEVGGEPSGTGAFTIAQLSLLPVVSSGSFTGVQAGPILISPTNHQTGVAIPVTVQWSSHPTALSYQVQIATDSGFNTIIDDDYTESLSYQFTTLEAGTLYYWRVRAVTVDDPPAAVYGLDFAGTAYDNVLAVFEDPASSGLPIFGPVVSGSETAGVTYIMKVYPRSKTGYFSTIFYANSDFMSGDDFYGFHPYPDFADEPNSFWEIAVDTQDILSSENVGYNQWYTQVARVWVDSSGIKHHEFYYDWPNMSKVVTYQSGNLRGDPPDPYLMIGNNTWSTWSEEFCGVIRGLQVYNKKLSDADVANELTEPMSTTDGTNNIWYLNVNPTPTDITDKSGKGHHLTWWNNNRPGLYEG